MAFNYQPLLISNLRYGLELGLKPWLLPQDAFAEMKNASLSNGVLSKRQGYVPFGRLVHRDTDVAPNNVVKLDNFVKGDLPQVPARPGSVSITAEDTAEVVTDDGNGNLTGTLGATGEIDYEATGSPLTPTFAINFVQAPGDLTVTYDYFPDLPCMGIFNYTTAAGSQDLLAWTTKRLNKYNEVSGHFEDIAGADLFSGYDYEFFWLSNWLNKGFMTNGLDQIRYYDGLDLTALVIDLDGDADNDLDSAYLIFPYKDRLVFLRTSEFGDLYPQRARWTAVGTYDQSDALYYVDAPTHEWIMGAVFVKNELVVFFERSVWILRYTGDSRLPFRWVRVASNEGLMSKMALMDFANEAIGLGPTHIFGSDGVEVYNLDDRIPQLVLEMNQGALAYCYATAVDELNQLWISYPSANQTLPDKAAVLNYQEKSFALFDLPHLVTGYFQESGDLTWDQIEETWDELERTWDERTMQAGYLLTLGGDHQGYVWKLNQGGSDNGAAIEMAARLGRMNPFISKGKKARLGWVDLLVDRNPLAQLTLQYYQDHESDPWKEDVITLDDGSASEMIWLRSYVGLEAVFHGLRLYNNAANQAITVHAIMPYFCEAGAID